MSDTPLYDGLCRETGLDPVGTGVLFRDRIPRTPRRHANRCKVCGRFTSAREPYDRFDCALRAVARS